MSELIVVGSGIGGLVTALRADAAGHSVTVVTKRDLSDSNTRYAQGGIAAAVFDDDSVAAHVEDTMSAGAGLSVREAVEVLCSEGPQRIRDLIRWGVAFDRSGDALARGLEAAHSSARILHAGGDSTGAAIEWALVDAVRASGVTVIEHAFATSLLQDRDGPTGARVAGVNLLMTDGTTLGLHADAVVLATGGAGQLYPHTTNPEVATGDGVALALRAGAVVRDLEFFQFHPTALAVPGNFLVSEAVRGEGAVLLNERGERFMTALHPDAELAPRDIVARAIAAEMAKQGGTPVRLDATALGANTLASRFPTIDRATRAAGLDWSRKPIPVTPAAHYWMGGVATDLYGRTSLPGLFAVGEVASTGVHGANRLASNSLLEAAVFGWRVSDALGLGEDDTGAEFPDSEFVDSEFVDVSAPAADHADVASNVVELDRGDIQGLLWEAAGLRRNGADLARAAETLAAAVPLTASNQTAPNQTGSNPAEADAAPATVRQHEDANLLDIARVLVASAAARQESRGAHFRTDFPEPSPQFAHPLALRGAGTQAREARIHAYS